MAEASIAAARPVEEGLFASLDPPRLVGSRCSVCSTDVFPAVASCPRCSSMEFARIELPDQGTVWSCTVQRFEPKLPYIAPEDGFRPYAVGYVDLGSVLVEARLIGDPEGFSIGQRVRLVLLPLPPAPGEIDPVVTYAFAASGIRPSEEAA